MKMFGILMVLFATSVVEGQETLHCEDMIRNARLPCICTIDLENGTSINCDEVFFFGDFPILPYRHRIHSFSQRHAGLQNLEAQLFTASDVPLKVVDFSHNLLRRLTERVFDGIENTVEEIYLSHNLFGDQLNPIFSTNELQGLPQLRVLDLSANHLRDLNSDIFRGLDKLEELNLGQNELFTIPASSLQGLLALKTIFLQENGIKQLPQRSFPNLPTMKLLNLTGNDISYIQDGAFVTLSGLETLLLSSNRLDSLPSEAFVRLDKLHTLDLSDNYFTLVPLRSLMKLVRLKKLILHSNNIHSLEGTPLAEMATLEFLDLRRNGIIGISANTFVGLPNMKDLLLDINIVRRLDESIFSGLEKLERLSLNDNQILAYPATTISSLKYLKKFNLDYNRIAVLSPNILRTSAKLEELSLAFNLIKEIPDNLFENFEALRLLNVHGNKIEVFNNNKIVGIQQSLWVLDLGYNDINQFPKLNLPKLFILSMARNKLSALVPDAFEMLQDLRYLNLSRNQIAKIPKTAFQKLLYLENLDLHENLLTEISLDVFKNLSLKVLDLSRNQLRELQQKSFQKLLKLERLDLSMNRLALVQNGAFDELDNLKFLNLRQNILSSFKGDVFTTRTGLETLDLSHNHITYLYPNSFTIHYKLKNVDLSFNRLTFFPSEILKAVQTLAHISLQGNNLQSLDNADFANMPNLKLLELQNNAISDIQDNTFQNSTQLHRIYLQNNQISSLPELAFRGISHLNLDLSNNSLSKLSPEIFNRMNVFSLESINLARNKFTEFPNLGLKRQYSFLEKLDLSHNKISNLPSNDDVLVNVKNIDLSHNPLTADAHRVLLGEPKSMRELNIAYTKLETLPELESPFLRTLNLSGNIIKRIDGNVFQKTNLLQCLDLSKNQIPNLSISLATVWSKITGLEKLDISNNPILYIVKGDFDPLTSLKYLMINDLHELTLFECESLKKLTLLKVVRFYGYPSLLNLAINDCLKYAVGLQSVSVDITEPQLQSQLQLVYSPRLREVDVRGRKLRSISSSAFAGIRSPKIDIKLRETTINDISTAIFLPLPISTDIALDVKNNKISSLSPQFLGTLDNKQRDISLVGLNFNPIICDCNALPLWRWIQKKIGSMEKRFYELTKLECFGPPHLAKQMLQDLQANSFVCGEQPITIQTSTITASSPTTQATIQHRENDIIFEPRRTTSRPTRKSPSASGSRSALTKVDTMIIAIVAGVVAFVCILIIIICVIRLRRARPHYTAGPLAGPLALRAQGKCTCLKPPTNLCNCYAPYPIPLSYIPTGLPHALPMRPRILSLPAPPMSGSTLGRAVPLKSPPYYVTYPESDNENR
ncbi:chaoptin-like [Limulus polyphemus]|uniref:Chaoptin-like n=1 Tax=Limulus polyphemus TaxID=6850 RepID=A0ABM1BSY8_LIMPO|nr:chaoptin-like [Limulus polyphemus]